MCFVRKFVWKLNYTHFVGGSTHAVLYNLFDDMKYHSLCCAHEQPLCSLGCGVLRCSGRERRMQFMGLWSLGESLYDQHSWVFLQLGVTDHFKLVYWIVFIYKYLCLLCANKSFILPKIYMISASITEILFKIAWIICINEFYFHMPGYTELRIHIL